MTDGTQTVDVDQTIDIGAPRERVFELLTRKEEIARWLPMLSAFEPSVGGRFEMTSGDWRIGGEVTEIDPPRVVAYSWRYLSAPPDQTALDYVTQVRFELEESGDGTVVHLTHTGFASVDDRTLHETEWHRHTLDLKRIAEGA